MEVSGLNGHSAQQNGVVMLCRVRISKVDRRSKRASHLANLTLRGVEVDYIREADIFVGDVEEMKQQRDTTETVNVIARRG